MSIMALSTDRAADKKSMDLTWTELDINRIIGYRCDVETPSGFKNRKINMYHVVIKHAKCTGPRVRMITATHRDVT
jgi:hypothetical protein